ncbi:MAG: choice-of-anchor D domain-containing protein, partial [Candidatus Acidiferrales bacterium]
TNFPTGGATAAFNAKSAGGIDAFLVSLSSGASGPLQLNYSTYLGGSKDDSGTAITVLSPSAVYVAGRTASIDFPVSGSLQAFSGLGDVFLSKFDVTSAGASSLVYSTLLAGTTSDEPHALAADTSGGLYLAGTAHSSDYPLAPHPSNGFQLACSNCGIATGSNDAFFTKLIENLPPTPIVSFSAPNMNFGLVAVGTTSNPKHVNLINSGAAALNVLSTAITGANPGDFSILASGSACPTGVFQLGPGTQCSLTVVFTPSAGTAESASLDINDNLAGSPQSLPLLGSGSAPVAQVSPASIEFGSVPIGAAGNGGTVTITNGGNIALILTEIKVNGANSADFAPSGNPTGDACPVAPGSLASGASCSVHIVFQPLAPGVRNAELDISDNSANIPGSLQKVLLSGTGTPSAPVASIFPTSHDFGGVPVVTTTLQTPVTLTNTGSLTLNISNIQISGNPDFSFAGAPNPACPLGAAGQLSPNSSCNLTAAFHPTSAGTETAQITFTDNSGGTAGTSQ